MTRPITRRGVPAPIRFIIFITVIAALVAITFALSRASSPPTTRGYAVHEVGKMKGYGPAKPLIIDLPTLTPGGD